jgi:hypothetical protein
MADSSDVNTAASAAQGGAPARQECLLLADISLNCSLPVLLPAHAVELHLMHRIMH